MSDVIAVARIRFRAKVNKAGPTVRPALGPCWLWTGAPTAKGRGVFNIPGRPVTVAARAAWILFHGEIPQGLMVCHHCDVMLCVNWESHLFLGTAGDNLRDMVSKGRSRSQKVTVCPQGHPYDSENTYINPKTGVRLCRACRKAVQARRGPRVRHGRTTTSSGNSTVS